MVRLPLFIISVVVLISAGYGFSKLFFAPVPEEVLKYMKDQASVQCRRSGDAVTYPTRQAIPGGWIYSSDFLGGKSDSYLIVTETSNGLELEDIHCPNQKENLLAF